MSVIDEPQYKAFKRYVKIELLRDMMAKYALYPDMKGDIGVVEGGYFAPTSEIDVYFPDHRSINYVLNFNILILEDGIIDHITLLNNNGQKIIEAYIMGYKTIIKHKEIMRL